MPWEENPNTIRSGHRAAGDPCRTIDISAKQGIKAVYCKYGDKWAIQSYLFSKDSGWTMAKAKAWFTQHKENLQESRHVSFQIIMDKFSLFFGTKKAAALYKQFVSENDLDETKPYNTDAQHMHESFEWTDPFIAFWKEDKDAKYYKTHMLSAQVSMNQADYSNPQHMKYAASNIAWRPLNLDHDNTLMLSFPANRIEVGKLSADGKSLEGVIRILKTERAKDTKEYIVNMIEDLNHKDRIRHPSIEADPIGGLILKDNKKTPRLGFYLTGLALLRKSFSLPGDPLSIVFSMPLNESMGKSLIESTQETFGLKENKNLRGEKTEMETQTKQEQIPETPETLEAEAETLKGISKFQDKIIELTTLLESTSNTVVALKTEKQKLAETLTLKERALGKYQKLAPMLEEARKSLAETEMKLSETEGEKASLEQQLTEHKQTIVDTKKKLEETVNKLGESHSKLKGTETKMAELAGTLAQAIEQRTQAMQEKADIQIENADLREEASNAIKQASEIADKRASDAKKLYMLEKENISAKCKLALAESELAKVKNILRKLKNIRIHV